MKTTIVTSILALSMLFFTINSIAEGVDTSSVTVNPAKANVNKSADFAFKLDANQIIKAAESVDLNDLTISKQKDTVTKSSSKLPFAFKLDSKQIKSEAQNTDIKELDAK